MRRGPYQPPCHPPAHSGECVMTPIEIARVEAYLRATFGNAKIRIDPPKKRGAPIEVSIADLPRDEDDGEVSYSLAISILDQDLPKIVDVNSRRA